MGSGQEMARHQVWHQRARCLRGGTEGWKGQVRGLEAVGAIESGVKCHEAHQKVLAAWRQQQSRAQRHAPGLRPTLSTPGHTLWRSCPAMLPYSPSVPAQCCASRLLHRGSCLPDVRLCPLPASSRQRAAGRVSPPAAAVWAEQAVGRLAGAPSAKR